MDESLQKRLKSKSQRQRLTNIYRARSTHDSIDAPLPFARPHARSGQCYLFSLGHWYLISQIS
jgi:hypothetical protein